MAADGGRGSWNEEDRLSSSCSDASPILSYRYEKYRNFAPYVRELKKEEKQRRPTLRFLAKFFLFCMAMIIFCVLMYIPVYKRANHQLVKGITGWQIGTDRSTKLYVHPNSMTAIHEPKEVCNDDHKDKNSKLFLLIIVCSAIENFDRRSAIRETWGRYETYVKIHKVLTAAQDKYKKYNFSYDLPLTILDHNVNNLELGKKTIKKRDISSFGQLLPELAKALQSNLAEIKTESVPDKDRYEEEKEESIEPLPQFDMNKELGEEKEHNNEEIEEKDDEERVEYGDYDYESSNIMRIPPRGFEEESPDLQKILTLLKQAKTFPENDVLNLEKTEPEFKLIFLLGLPSDKNDTRTQDKIEEEIEKYDDVIQENFIDSYYNLTLKSIMMLKWITNKCKDNVRYIMKTDDDVYVNVPNLVINLQKRASQFDKENSGSGKEDMLIGSLIAGAKPVQNARDKWYSPRYMYAKRMYPPYLSGTGYALSSHTAKLLYEAALITPYFHLEDIYITGMCTKKASPPLKPQHDKSFTYRNLQLSDPCCAHSLITVHRVNKISMIELQEQLLQPDVQDLCERRRLMKIKMESQKTTPRSLVHHP